MTIKRLTRLKVTADRSTNGAVALEAGSSKFNLEAIADIADNGYVTVYAPSDHSASLEAIVAGSADDIDALGRALLAAARKASADSGAVEDGSDQ